MLNTLYHLITKMLHVHFYFITITSLLTSYVKNFFLFFLVDKNSSSKHSKTRTKKKKWLWIVKSRFELGLSVLFLALAPATNFTPHLVEQKIEERRERTIIIPLSVHSSRMGRDSQSIWPSFPTRDPEICHIDDPVVKIGTFPSV